MKKLNWRHMDAKVSPDRNNPVLLIFYQNYPCNKDDVTIGVPLRGQDIWNLMKLLVRSWFAHLRLKWSER